jgi:pimeloyl-ACP methyl ester carboxylesterase
MFYRKIETTQGEIAVLESAGNGTPVLFIHGNSSCKEVFHWQFEGELARTFRLIALDLPGHGRSVNAREPKRAYTVPGYADVVIQLLHALKIDRAILLGWSLGGHIGLEMLGQGYNAAGLMIIGAPPVSRGIFGMMRGFQSQFDLFLATKSRLTPTEIERFANICLGNASNSMFRDMIARTDPRARPILARSMVMGTGADQRWIAEHSPVPIAVLNGSREPFARLDYVAGLDYGNLWDGRCHVIEGAGHAPFIEAPASFDLVLRRFIDDVSHGRAVAPDARSRTARQIA